MTCSRATYRFFQNPQSDLWRCIETCYDINGNVVGERCYARWPAMFGMSSLTHWRMQWGIYSDTSDEKAMEFEEDHIDQAWEKFLAETILKESNE